MLDTRLGARHTPRCQTKCQMHAQEPDTRLNVRRKPRCQMHAKVPDAHLGVERVARSRQVCIYWVVEALLVYLPKGKRTSIYVRSTFLATLPPSACPAEPFSYLCVAEPVRTGE